MEAKRKEFVDGVKAKMEKQLHMFLKNKLSSAKHYRCQF